MADLRQSSYYAKYLNKIGWEVEKVGINNIFIKSAPIIGSIIKIQRPKEIDHEALLYATKKHKAIQVIIEPRTKKDTKVLTKAGFSKSKTPYLPTKTLRLDLTMPIEKLYKQLKKDTKYSIKKTKNTRIYSIDKVKGFRSSWKKAVNYKRWVPPKKHLSAMQETFKDNVLFLITPSGDAGAIFVHTKNTAYYWQAFTSPEGRKSLSQYKIVWAGIVWAKRRGAKVFDFEGIYDERFPNKTWKGFTHFKKSFGGYEVEYPGAFTKFLLPFK